MKNKYVLVWSVVCVTLILDQLTKFQIEKRLKMFEVVRIIPGFFNLTRVRNRGAAFGILSEVPGIWRSLFFVTITIAAVVVISMLIRKTHERLLVLSFSLIIGGALGNLIDRVRYGEVVDFIQWYVKSFYWPSFNVADSAITVGVGLLMIDMLFQKDQNTPASAEL